MAHAAKALGFLGGSFDPIHRGHLHLAQEVRKVFALDKIYLIPNASPPHKERNFSSYENRLQMSRLALSSLNHRQYQVSLLEQDPGKLHYTYDSLKALRSRYGAQARLYFIMGMDSLLALDSWYRGLELTDFTNLVVLPRPHYCLNYENTALPTAKPSDQQTNPESAQRTADTVLSEALKNYLKEHVVKENAPDFNRQKFCTQGKIFLLNSRQFDISSTRLRATLTALSAAEQPNHYPREVRSMLNPAVLHYISSHQLYRSGNGSDGTSS